MDTLKSTMVTARLNLPEFNHMANNIPLVSYRSN